MKISSRNYKYYKNLNYNFDTTGDIIEVKVSDLPNGSQYRIDVKCEICGYENNIIYAKYIKNKRNYNIYSCNKCKNIKTKKTLNSLYGVDNVSQLDYVKSKRKLTTLENYGVENPSQSDIIKDRKKKTTLENYGVENILQNRDLMELKMFEKHGVKRALTSDTIYNEMTKGLLEKYNVDNVSKLDYVKNKKIETCLKNHGVESPAQSKEIRDKMKKTTLEKYGVEYAIQSKDIFEKQLRSSFKVSNFDDKLFYQASYELDFLNYCKSKNIIKFIENGISIDYIMNNKKRVYHSDFYIPKLNLVIEIKSSYTYNKEIDKNLIKEKYSKMNYNFLLIKDKDYMEFDYIVTKLNLDLYL